jgi:hypothetical protein
VLLAGAGKPPIRKDTVDRCSPQSLAAIGESRSTGLDDITRTMTKVDRLAPGAAPAEPPAEAAPAEGAGAGSEAPGTALPPDFVAPAEPVAPPSE